MSDTFEKQWYVVKTVSGQEHKTKTYIQNEITRLGFDNQLEEILVPTEKMVQIRRGKKVSKERVYFPGYVMIKASLEGEIVHVVKSLTGVIGFLGEVKGGDPIPLRKNEVNRLLGKVDELIAQDENLTLSFTVGDSVKVIDGPFNGFNGNVEVINEEKRKLEVVVKIFGRKTPIELSYMQVDKI